MEKLKVEEKLVPRIMVTLDDEEFEIWDVLGAVGEILYLGAYDAIEDYKLSYSYDIYVWLVKKGYAFNWTGTRNANLFGLNKKKEKELKELSFYLEDECRKIEEGAAI